MNIDSSFGVPGAWRPKPHHGPVTPLIPGEHVAGGYRMRNLGATSMSVLQVAGAILGYGVLAVVGFAILRLEQPWGCALYTFAAMLLGGCAYATFRTLQLMVRTLREATSLGAAELVVEPWPLRLGDGVKLRFFRAQRQRLPVVLVEAFIECNEWYVEEDDDSSVWRSRRRRTINLGDTALPAIGEPLRCEWTARISDQDIASAMLMDSAITWRVCVRLYTDPREPMESEFKLLVLPEIRV